MIRDLNVCFDIILRFKEIAISSKVIVDEGQSNMQYCLPIASNRRSRFEAINLDRGDRIRSSNVSIFESCLVDRVAGNTLKHKRLASIEREIRTVLQRYGVGESPKTLQEIADQQSLTRERVRQLEGRGLERLRSIDFQGIEMYERICETLMFSDGIIFYSEIESKSHWNILKLLADLARLKGLEVRDEFATIGVWNNAYLQHIIDRISDLYWRGGKSVVLEAIAKAIPFEKTCIQAVRVSERFATFAEIKIAGSRPKTRDLLVRQAILEIADTAHFTAIAKLTAKMEGEQYSDVYAHGIHAVLLRYEETFVRPGGRGMFSLVEFGARQTQNLRNEMESILQSTKRWMSAVEIIEHFQASSRYTESSVLLTAGMFEDDFVFTPYFSLIGLRDVTRSTVNPVVGERVRSWLKLNQGSNRHALHESLLEFGEIAIDVALCFGDDIVMVGSSRDRRLVVYDRALPRLERVMTRRAFAELVAVDKGLSGLKSAVAHVRQALGWLDFST